jgi:Protein of unknown function (DUF4239)
MLRGEGAPRVNLLLVTAIVVAVSVAAVGLMHAVRRRMKRDHFFVEAERGAGIFAFLGTAFAVLLAFVFFEAFESFHDARTGAESEATSVLQLTRSAAFFPEAERTVLAGEMICYGRAVIEHSWPAMKRGERSEVVQDWVDRFERSLRDLDTRSPEQEAVFLRILEQEDERAVGRRERLSEATRSLPPPVWFLLGLGAVLTIGITLLFADRREEFLVQGGLMAAVAALVTSGLLLVWFLDHPYEDQSGSIQPAEMERQLEIVEEENPDVAPPCDPRGEPLATASKTPRRTSVPS